MKTIKIIFALALIVALSTNMVFANQSKYKLAVINLINKSANTLEFDIVLNKNKAMKESLNYSGGQYFLEFNLGIANKGTLTYSLIDSDLPIVFRPMNASVKQNILRLATNMLQSESAPDIPVTGLLIAKMRLETSADKFSKEDLELNWTGEENIYKTQIATFEENKMIEITDSKNHFIDLDNSIDELENKITDNSIEIAQEYSLSQNYPNPFNPNTIINYQIPASAFSGVNGEGSNIKLVIYNTLGKEVATLVNEIQSAGSYSVEWNAGNFASGVYFYKISATGSAGSFSAIKRMLLIK